MTTLMMFLLIQLYKATILKIILIIICSCLHLYSHNALCFSSNIGIQSVLLIVVKGLITTG